MIMKFAKQTAPSRKRDDKGFSLIELIIVITIMAILTALLAPQLLRYVEQSRQARDRANVDTVYHAFQIACTSESVTITPGNIVYQNDGRLTGIGPTLGAQIEQLFGYKYETGNVVRGLPPLTSKLYQGVNIAFNFKWNDSAKKEYVIVTFTHPAS